MITGARLVDLDGTELLALEDPVRLQALSLGFPDVRAVSVPMPGQSGEVDTTRFTGASAITLDLGVLDNGDTGRDLLIDQVRGLCQPSRRIWLHVTSSDWPAERRILIRGDQAPVAFSQPGAQAVSVGFRAPSGLWESVTLNSAVLFPTTAATGGVAMPLGMPATFDAGNVSGASTLHNAGTVPSLPFFDIYGDCDDPVLRNLTTGERLAFSGLSIQQGDFVRVDMANRVVLLLNDAGQSRYSTLDFTSLSWWALAPGDTSVAFAPNNPGSACQAIAYWSDTYI
jgi:hypothetical protein